MPREVSWPMRALFITVTYALAGWSVYSCAVNSEDLLSALLKTCSGIHFAIWGNFLIVHYCLFVWAIIRVLFGRLTAIEYDHIFERLHVVLVTLASIVFTMRDHYVAGHLTILFYTLCLVAHWVLRDRMDYVFQAYGTETNLLGMFCSRFMFSLLVLGMVDYKMLRHCVQMLYEGNKNTQNLYLTLAVSFAQLMLDVLHVVLLTSLNLIELVHSRRNRRANVAYEGGTMDDDADDEVFILEGKYIYETVFDLTITVVKVMLDIIQEVFGTYSITVIYSIFVRSIQAGESFLLVYNYWKNNKKLYEKLSDVTEEQLDDSDSMCIICMDDMLPATESTTVNRRAKMLPCGHMLHFGCLKSWMERSQTCPICRLSVFANHSNTNANVQAREQTPPDLLQERGIEERIEVIGLQEMSVQSISVHEGTAVHRGNSGNHMDQTLEGSLFGREDRDETRWLAFPVEFRADSKIFFNLNDSQGGREWLASYSAYPRATLMSSEEPGKISQLHSRLQSPAVLDSAEGMSSQVERAVSPKDAPPSNPCLVIPTSRLEQTKEVEHLKRKVEELESRVEELSKRIKTDQGNTEVCHELHI
ncbi:AaceriACL019Cp [[Ashbya] aceris (nom. inval.)]|nr:AaceriACL019Cp [[Ashbya] aceris (nom. inval.)]